MGTRKKDSSRFKKTKSRQRWKWKKKKMREKKRERRYLRKRAASQRQFFFYNTIYSNFQNLKVDFKKYYISCVFYRI